MIIYEIQAEYLKNRYTNETTTVFVYKKSDLFKRLKEIGWNFSNLLNFFYKSFFIEIHAIQCCKKLNKN